jgi:hypothetical protein
MKMLHREKNLSYSHFTGKSCTGFKFLKLWKKLVEKDISSLLVLCILRSTVLKKKVSLSLDGEMKVEQNEAERDDVITSSQEVELPPLTSSKLFEQACWVGIQSNLYSTEPLDLEEFANFLEMQKTKIELFEKGSKLAKKIRRYSTNSLDETWASHWISAPVAYLFSEERREEYLGDLYEINQLSYKGYPLWIVNIIILGRTAVWGFSALEIKFKNFLPLKILKRD